MKTKILTYIVILFTIFSCQKIDNQKNISYKDIPLESSISLTQAIDVANKFFANNNFTKSNDISNIKSTKIITDSYNKPLIYIINYNPTGYVIISSTRDFFPIIAFSKEHQFNDHTSNSSISFWIETVKNNIQNSYTLTDSIKNRISLSWQNLINHSNLNEPKSTVTKTVDMETLFQNRIEELRQTLPETYSFHRLSEVFDSGDFPDTDGAYYHYCTLARQYESQLEYTIVGINTGQESYITEPLLNTNWSQNFPYNYLCDNPNEPAGCGTIAIAQIMNYYRHPNSYQWDDMHIFPNTQILIRDVKRALGNTHSSNNNTINNALHSFEYESYYSNHSSSSAFNQLYYSRKPILMTGILPNSNSGHAWICDGVQRINYFLSYFIEVFYRNEYQSPEDFPSIEAPNRINGGHYNDTYYHMNWGWGGDCNGWYLNEATNTTYGNFSSDRKDFYINIH